MTRQSQADGGTGAGDYSAVYLLINNRSTPCTLSGFPGVSFLSGGGYQVGVPAPRDRGTSAQTVTLGPGKGAAFTVRAEVVGGSRCPMGVQHAAAIKVFPPNQTVPLVVGEPFVFCALTAVTAVRSAP